MAALKMDRRGCVGSVNNNFCKFQRKAYIRKKDFVPGPFENFSCFMVIVNHTVPFVYVGRFLSLIWFAGITYLFYQNQRFILVL